MRTPLAARRLPPAAAPRRAATAVAARALAAPGVRVPGLPLLAALVLPALVLATPAARAQRLGKVDGAGLAKVCALKQPSACDGYINGVTDTVELLQRSHAEPQDSNPMQFCIPPEVTTQALRETVVAWAQGHPDAAKQPAGMMVLQSLRASYPCKGGTPARP